jgi:hypothetical protein
MKYKRNCLFPSKETGEAASMSSRSKTGAKTDADVLHIRHNASSLGGKKKRKWHTHQEFQPEKVVWEVERPRVLSGASPGAHWEPRSGGGPSTQGGAGMQSRGSRPIGKTKGQHRSALELERGQTHVDRFWRESRQHLECTTRSFGVMCVRHSARQL